LTSQSTGKEQINFQQRRYSVLITILRAAHRKCGPPTGFSKKNSFFKSGLKTGLRTECSVSPSVAENNSNIKPPLILHHWCCQTKAISIHYSAEK
jgi:hypothetical protein